MISNSIYVDIKYLFSRGKQIAESVINVSSLDIYSIDILGAVSVEILIKSLIASNIVTSNLDKTENQMKSLIMTEFRKLSHRINEIFDAVPALKQNLGIESIKLFNESGMVNHYIIKLDNGGEFVMKELESARYGSFAAKKDVFSGMPMGINRDFLSRIVSFVDSKIEEDISLLSKHQN